VARLPSASQDVDGRDNTITARARGTLLLKGEGQG
jgi:hypothetical protein